MGGRCFVFLTLCALLLFTGLGGCNRKQPPSDTGQKPLVVASLVVQRTVQDAVEFTGRTEAVQSVDIRARVTGYLTQLPFKEGAEVKTGDLLFEIDRRPYQAQLDKAQSEVVLNEARLKLAVADNARAKNIAKMNPAAISLQDLDKYQAAQDEADAAVKASKAGLEGYKINLDFTRVTSPIDGQVSRYYYTLGNLVNQDQTLLTTVVSQDPIYTYFDGDERTLLRVMRQLRADQAEKVPITDFPLYMALADEEGYPHKGNLNFANNVVDPSTGTVTLRGVFANPASTGGYRLLRPGMFVRVQLPTGKPYPGLLIADRALATDQGQKYVLVVDDKNIVQQRRVQTGRLEADGLRVISDGLKAGERVIISGLQLVRPRTEVQVEMQPMPTIPVPARAGKPPEPKATSKETLPAPDQGK